MAYSYLDPYCVLKWRHLQIIAQCKRNLFIVNYNL